MRRGGFKSPLAPVPHEQTGRPWLQLGLIAHNPRMEPQIRYTTTADGVSIAWAEMGEGPPLLVCGATPFTHVQAWAAIFESSYGPLARFCRLIWFDARGTGMSERDVTVVSAATLLMDAEAVIAAAKIDHFAAINLGNLLSLSVALQLATERQEQVTHLVLWSPYQRMNDVADTQYAKVGRALAEADWPSYVAAIFLVLFGFDAAANPEFVEMAKAAGAWADPAVGLLYRRLEEATDLGDLLRRVTQPTLVVREENHSFPSARVSQRIAAQIPGAQFRQYSHARGDHTADLALAFLGLSTSSSPANTPAAPSAFRTVLFTDIVGHTEMMQRLGDAKGRDLLREHERITRDLLKQHGGAEVKTMGDGFMASFGSVTSAMECAIALQRAFAAHTESMPEPLHVRVGLNAGEPLEEDGDLFGATVILASRIAAKAGAGEILIPEPVRHLLSGKTFVFSDRGEYEMKGFDDAVRLYEVRWQEQ